MSQTDFDIHGLVGVRLIGASDADVGTVVSQIGAMQRPLNREPDIVVRFVDELPTLRLQYVELQKSGFTEDGFFILQCNKKHVKVKIAFDGIGTSCEIVCEHRAPAIPLLLAIINLAALKYDYVSLHASAFIHRGTGVVVTGWAKGGKTEALLAFARAGAQYVGDEWILLSGNGQHMLGIPEHIRLWEWHLQQMPELRTRVKTGERRTFQLIHAAEALRRGFGHGALSKTLPCKLLDRGLPAFRRQLNIRLNPRLVFGDRFGPFRGTPNKLFLMLNSAEQKIEVEPADPIDVARRMLASICCEQLPFFQHYLGFKFAFPHLANPYLEQAGDLQARILVSALRGKETYFVRHPYPVNLQSLYEAMAPYVDSCRRGADRSYVEAV